MSGLRMRTHTSFRIGVAMPSVKHITAGPAPADVRAGPVVDGGALKYRAARVGFGAEAPGGLLILAGPPPTPDGPGWTGDDVAARLEAAFRTLARLPKDGPRGYRCCLPEMLRDASDVWARAVERGGFESPRLRLGPPPPAAIDEMVEALWWLMWVDGDRRKLLQAHALMGGRPDWKALARRLGRDQRTLRRWRRDALTTIADRLNAEEIEKNC